MQVGCCIKNIGSGKPDNIAVAVVAVASAGNQSNVESDLSCGSDG